MFNYKKIPYFRYIPVILISLILYKVVNNPEILRDGFSYVTSIFSYLIWAFFIAFLLNPVMVYLEDKFKFGRILSISVIYLVFVSLIVFIITILTPIIAKNTSEFLGSLPDYFDKTEKLIIRIISDLKLDDRYDIAGYIENNLNVFLKDTNDILKMSLNFVVERALSITSIILKLIIGLLISIYLLYDKEIITDSFRQFIFAFFSRPRALAVVKFGRKLNTAFAKYIVGKFVDSAIIGTLCFIGLFVINVRYASLISLIVGVTNLIPYIGGVFGIIPAGIITLLVSPDKSIWVLLFLVVLQQFDSWILSPKIIGGKIGLSPLTIIVALMVGGGLLGLVGMFLAIPLFAVGKDYIVEYMENKAEAKEAGE